MKSVTPNSREMVSLLEVMAQAGIGNAAAGLSEMIGRKISVTVPRVTSVPIRTVPERVGGPEALVVGIYLASEGDLTGHIMLIMDYDEALQLADLLLGQASGQTRELDSLARSALAEAGNLAASFFLNAVFQVLGRSGRPSPPAVIVDMAGAILDVMLVSAGQLSDEVLLLETVFQDDSRALRLFFWVLPDLVPLESLLH